MPGRRTFKEKPCTKRSRSTALTVAGGQPAAPLMELAAKLHFFSCSCSRVDDAAVAAREVGIDLDAAERRQLAREVLEESRDDVAAAERQHGGSRQQPRFTGRRAVRR